MGIQQVFSNNLDASIVNLSNRFTDAIAFYVDTPLSNFELEIDCYLQIYLPTNNQEKVRVIPLGKIEEQSILLNLVDTESVVFIPEEYQDTGLEMALLFVPSNFTTVYFEVFVIKKIINLQIIGERLLAIQNLLLSGTNLDLDFIYLHYLGFI
jgi:carbohydrate-binding DOMON domain-containing protein